MEDGLPLEFFVISLVIIFLFILIILCILKLNIFFNSYNFLSKKINADKVTHIANISFYKFYYNKKERLQGVTIERLIMATFLILAIVAIVGIILNKGMNYGVLNYYYGDVDEYSFLNIFIILMIILSIIYCFSYAYCFINEKEEDDKLDESENILREFIINNIDYKYLKYYTSRKDVTIGEDDKGILNTYISENKTPIKSLLDGTENSIYLFQLCFTYHLMNSNSQINPKFRYITKDIKERLKEIKDIDKKNEEDAKEEIRNALSDIDIIANYNHSNDTAIPQLYILINDLKKNGLNDDNNKLLNPSIETITANLINKESKDEKAMAILGIYEKAKTCFRNPIIFFKKMYDKYYMYYTISIFITNIILIYAILIFIYIFIRLISKVSGESYESVYENKLNFKRYIIYILLFYYLITCPIIIFSYN